MTTINNSRYRRLDIKEYTLDEGAQSAEPSFLADREELLKSEAIHTPLASQHNEITAETNHTLQQAIKIIKKSNALPIHILNYISENSVEFLLTDPQDLPVPQAIMISLPKREGSTPKILINSAIFSEEYKILKDVYGLSDEERTKSIAVTLLPWIAQESVELELGSALSRLLSLPNDSTPDYAEREFIGFAAQRNVLRDLQLKKDLYSTQYGEFALNRVTSSSEYGALNRALLETLPPIEKSHYNDDSNKSSVSDRDVSEIKMRTLFYSIYRNEISTSGDWAIDRRNTTEIKDVVTNYTQQNSQLNNSFQSSFPYWLTQLSPRGVELLQTLIEDRLNFLALDGETKKITQHFYAEVLKSYGLTITASQLMKKK